MINKRLNNHIRGHRIISVMILCLFGFCLMQAMQAPKKHARKRPHGDRVYLCMQMNCTMICSVIILMPKY